MKLLWVFPSFEMGGAQRRFASLCAALPKGYHHQIFAMNGVFEAEQLLPKEASWSRHSFGFAAGKLGTFANTWKIAQFLKKESPDLLLTCNWGSIEWHLANRYLSYNRVPHLHFEDGFGPEESSGTRYIRRDMMRRAAFANRFQFGTQSKGSKRGFIAPSHGLATLFETVWGVDKKQIHLIPNGVDIQHFQQAIAWRTPTIGRPLVLGSVGALRPEKRFDRLLRIFAQARQNTELTLRIVGDGGERAHLEALAESLSITDAVTFVGARHDIPKELAQMDIYALTSDTEQMPISLIEAMAAGLPVVATDVGDVSMMLPDSACAYVLKTNDENGLSNAIIALAENRYLARKLGQENSEYAIEKYCIHSISNKYHNLFMKFIQL